MKNFFFITSFIIFLTNLFAFTLCKNNSKYKIIFSHATYIGFACMLISIILLFENYFTKLPGTIGNILPVAIAIILSSIVAHLLFKK